MQTIQKFKHEMSILDPTGDTKLIWDSDNRDEVENARKTFKDLKKKGFLAYSVSKKGDKRDVMHEFDEDAERIIMSPQMRGG